MHPPKVYIDTCVLKASSTQLLRLRPRQKQINWGGHVFETTVHDFININPNDSITNPELKKEAELLPELAEAGKNGRVKYVTQTETLIESWGLPKMDSATGIFYNAPYYMVDAPIRYSRVICGGLDHPKERQFAFLSSIKAKRFIELQKMTGAYQGNRGLNESQLLDAFHIWCAEHNRCDYFLTLDFKLIRVVRQTKKPLHVKVVCPSELLAIVK